MRMSRLAARYRRLLIGYPRDYRREMADEIIGVFLDAVPPGRARPTAREAVNLLGHGLRCRLGRPASRVVVVWAALTAVVCGLFTAAAATRLAWETARPLPAATPIFSELLPGHDLTGKVEGSPAMFVVWGEPFGPQHINDLLFGDGGEYGFGSVGATLPGLSEADTGRTLTTAKARLDADGWQVSPTTVTRHDADTTETTLEARRGDDILAFDLLAQPRYRNMQFGVTLNRATPWAVWPVGVAGLLLGALAGWLAFGWASRRTEWHGPAVRALTATLYGLATLLWTFPIVVSVPASIEHHLAEQHFRWHPLWEWLGQPAASLLFVAGAAFSLLAAAVAALPRRSAALAADPDHG
jgi:hypothetical protein